MMNDKPIGVYTLFNTMGIAVYGFDYFEDKVLAGINDGKPEWCEMCTEDDRIGFMFHGWFVPFDEVMRV